MMRNKEVLNEIRKQSRTLIEEKRDKFVKQSLLSDEFIDMMQRNRKPFDLLMSYYQCAIMEIETKFKVLNEEYSLEYDKNPIEGIKSRIKSYDSLLKKIRRKDIPMTLESIEKNITDIAGVRVICSFPADYRTGTDPGMVRVTGDRYSVICICGSFPADHTSGGIRCFSPCHSDPRSKTALWRSGITGCEKSPDSRSTYLCGSTCIGDPAAGSTDPDFQTE